MKHILIILLCAFTFSLGAQENSYSINTGGKKINFSNVSELTIEGVDGNELTIQREKAYRVDERATGLRKISATGKQDNTGMGVSVDETSDGILIEQIGNKCNRLIVKIPNTAFVKINSVGHQMQTLIVNNFAGELDITNEYNDMKLVNVSGPVAASSVYGDITAIFSEVPKEAIHLTSSYSTVDLTLPAQTKANVNLRTGYGSMYTDFDLEVPANNEINKHNASGLEATINGGGPNIVLIATYKDIYLRKK